VTPGNSSHDDEAKVRAVIDSWAKAIAARDVDAVMSHYTADIVAFDLAPPLECAGAHALRKSLEGVVPDVPGPSRLRDSRPLDHGRR
jgi:ketosteroid isomerase-like protein